LRNDHSDFVIFKNAYEAAHGNGSFAAMLAVPEPSSIVLLALAALLVPLKAVRRIVR
jgi:hypothetical protein